jgi:hypothetical protein
MNKLEYLKRALELKLYTKKSWLITAFSVTKPHEGDPYPGKLSFEPWSYNYIDDQGQVQKIETTDPNEALFRFKDKITVDSSWAPNIKEPVETCIGNLLFNYISILSSFGPKHPFPLGKISVSALEEKIAEKLQNTPGEGQPRSTEYYYVDEYVKFVDSLQYLSTLTQISTWAATPKGIVAPTGIKAFKAELVKKYGESLRDPVQLAKFEQELLDYDAKFLQDDPANGTFLAGKIKHTARKKMFLAMGAEQNFTGSQKAVPVTNSLSEGWPTDPERFTASMNGLRIGSFSRGAETVKGGVAAKYLLRAANNFKINDTDCGSKLGIRRDYTQDNFTALVGRYVVSNGKTVLVENKEQAGNYLGQRLAVRTPMYCKLKGDNLCKVCAGVRFSKFPTGLTIPLTEISAIILTASLKMMHVSNTTTAKLRLKESLT